VAAGIHNQACWRFSGRFEEGRKLEHDWVGTVVSPAVFAVASKRGQGRGADGQCVGVAMTTLIVFGPSPLGWRVSLSRRLSS